MIFFRDISDERILHFGHEISLLAAHLLVLFARDIVLKPVNYQKFPRIQKIPYFRIFAN